MIFYFKLIWPSALYHDAMYSGTVCENKPFLPSAALVEACCHTKSGITFAVKPPLHGAMNIHSTSVSITYGFFFLKITAASHWTICSSILTWTGPQIFNSSVYSFHLTQSEDIYKYILFKSCGETICPMIAQY